MIGVAGGARARTADDGGAIARARADVDGFALPWSSFDSLLDERADDHRIGFVWAGDDRREWTGAEWVRDARRVAHRLQRAGVGEGDELALVAENRPATLLLAFAAWLIGATFVPIDPRETPERRAEVLSDCAQPVLVGEVVPEPAGMRVIGLDELMPTAEDATSIRPPRGGLDVVALRMQTSGTSGTPKPILIPLRALLLDCAAMQAGFGWDSRTRTLTVLPICHANGLVISSFLPWFVGGSSVLVDRFSARRFWPLVREERVTVCSLVPTVLEYLIAYDGATGGVGSLREVFSGSGPLRPQTAAAFEERYGVPLRQLYGLSETSAVVTVTPPCRLGGLEGEFRASIGVAVPHVEVDVFDSTGAPCSEGEQGELVVRGGVLTTGYAGRPEATARAFAGGWFHTGDRGSWKRGPDGRRWYFLHGRLDDVIRRAGSAVLPHAVDAVIATHPDVSRAATFGFPHRWYGEEVGVAVVPCRDFDREAFLDWCERRLGYDSAPKAVVLVPALPETAVGKIRRGVLTEQLAPQLAPLRETRFRRRTTSDF